LLRRQEVDPGSDGGQDVGGKVRRVAAALLKRGRELLDEQRVPSGDVHQPLDRRGCLRGGAEEIRRDTGGIRPRQRLQGDGGLGRQSGTPRGSHVRQLGAGEREEDDWGVANM
jgi:hypothetical protein